MSLKNNPYEDLLKFFDDAQKTKQKTSTPVRSGVEKKKEDVSDTKKIIQDSKIFGYVPNNKITTKKYKSDGFKVSDFESMMRTKLIEEHKKVQSYERPYISVSELCTCLRQCYYSRMKYEVNTKSMFNFSYLYLIQRVGDTVHELIQNIYGFSETEKTIISDTYKVKGRVDGIKSNFVYEIKTVDEGKVNDSLIANHFKQANIYAFILNKEYNYEITTITIVYVYRNLRTIIPVDKPIDEKSAKSILRSAPILKQALDTKKVIDPYGATDTTCQFCSYKKYCKKDACIEVTQPFNKKVKKQKTEKVEVKEQPKVENKKQEDNEKPKTAFLL